MLRSFNVGHPYPALDRKAVNLASFSIQCISLFSYFANFSLNLASKNGSNPVHSFRILVYFIDMKVRILWSLLLGVIFTIVIALIAKPIGINLNNNAAFYLVSLILPILLLLLHSIWTLSFPRAVFFISLAFIIGLMAEISGLQNGTVFGGHYIYNHGGLMMWNVPILIPFYWAVYIYTGYTITNSFLVWMSKEKPSIKNKFLFILPLLILIDGLIVVAIDLFMDPIEVKKGSWTWLGGGQYFGVPIGNFIGWFEVTILVTAVFRLFEYFNPFKSKINNSVYLIPVIGYGMLSLYFFSSSLKLNMPELAMIGIFLMMPISLLNLTFYSYYRKRGT